MMDLYTLGQVTKLLIKRRFRKVQAKDSLFNRTSENTFENQADINLIPVAQLIDLYRAVDLFKRLVGDKFVAAYVRGSTPLGQFTPGKSDLDIILFHNGPTIGNQDLQVFLSNQLNKLLKKYTKVDVEVLHPKDLTNLEGTRVNIELFSCLLEGTPVTDVRKVASNSPALWGFYSNIRNIAPEQAADTLLSPNGPNYLKCLIRAVFSKAANQSVYAKGILEIQHLARLNKGFKAEASVQMKQDDGNPLTVLNILRKLTKYYPMLTEKETMRPFDKNDLLRTVTAAIRYLNS